MKRNGWALEADGGEDMSEKPVACCHSVFTKEQRAEYSSIWGKLQTRRLSTTELDHGYRYTFPGDAETLRLVNEWVSMERRCCPFLTFSVIVKSEDEPILLQLTGSKEAKAFLQTDIQANIDIITKHGDH